MYLKTPPYCVALYMHILRCGSYMDAIKTVRKNNAEINTCTRKVRLLKNSTYTHMHEHTHTHRTEPLILYL